MRGKKWIDELRSLVNRYSVDTELDAPDWLIAERVDSIISNFKMFSCHLGYTPLNNSVCTVLQATNKRSVKRVSKNVKRTASRIR